MKIDILSLFPEMFDGFLKTSIIKRAIDKEVVDIQIHNFREFTHDKHKHVDDYPYGGGAGMVMQAAPVYRCYKAIEKEISNGSVAKDKGCCGKKANVSGDLKDICNADTGENLTDKKKTKVIYLSPQGKTFNQEMAREFAKEENLIFLCGHYEGIDERVLEEIVSDYVSIGDYVLTGGELPALVMMDTISRLVPGVLNNDMSAQTESFSDNLLEYPQYTRPENWEGKLVPPVLLSGNHKKLAEWYREQSVIRTAKRRPDLIERAELTQKERELAERIMAGEEEGTDKK